MGLLQLAGAGALGAVSRSGAFFGGLILPRSSDEMACVEKT